MLKLMQQCKQVDKNRDSNRRKSHSYSALYERDSSTKYESDPNIQADAPQPSMEEDQNNRGLANPFSVFSGVFPGTKWCGTGDIAKDFHDLGTVR